MTAASLDLDAIIALLKQAKHPPATTIRAICELAIPLLTALPNVVSVPMPVTVCGDTHGQLFDLFELFAIGGQCPYTNYLFLGDYVDRGYFSLETFLLLLTLKIRFPQRMTILRGNHESRQTTQAYGFYDEIMRKFNDASLWQFVNTVFDLLPICAVVGGKVFCVHGGLSPLLTDIEQIQRIERKREVPERGPFCDLLWSDPETIPSFTISPRGAGYLYGETAVRSFCHRNKFTLICRAHQLASDGYTEWFDRRLFTVWSAPNYCYRGGNPASMLEIDEKGTTKWKMFEAAPADARGHVPEKTTLAYFL
jgi:serine/threonine-protein phosphatase 4 catalytic subunit